MIGKCECSLNNINKYNCEELLVLTLFSSIYMVSSIRAHNVHIWQAFIFAVHFECVRMSDFKQRLCRRKDFFFQFTGVV